MYIECAPHICVDLCKVCTERACVCVCVRVCKSACAGSRFRLAAATLLPCACRDDVNMVAVLKAMGAEADQEVMQLAGNDETLSALLVPTIQVCGGQGYEVQRQGLVWGTGTKGRGRVWGKVCGPRLQGTTAGREMGAGNAVEGVHAWESVWGRHGADDGVGRGAQDGAPDEGPVGEILQGREGLCGEGLEMEQLEGAGGHTCL